MESELQTEKNQSLNTKQEMASEIERLVAENERLEKLLQGNLGPAQTKMEAYMQHEIARLTTENLNLQVNFAIYFHQYLHMQNILFSGRKRYIK